MDDSKINDLYWARSEQAIVETENKYSGYCYAISFNILNNREDAEECVNDTYMRAWNSIPPHRPERLSVYLAKICRNLSIDKYRHYKAEKRGAGQTQLALSELEGCLPSSKDVTKTLEEAIDENALIEAINFFLETLATENRKVFMRRYWFVNSIKEIAQLYGISESKVKSILFRARKKLKRHLEEGGIEL